MLKETEKLISYHESHIVKNIDTSNCKKPYVLQNSLSWDREEWVKVENTWKKILVPGMGYAVIDGVSDGHLFPDQPAPRADTLENDFLKITFTKEGSIASIIDKELQQEILSPASRKSFRRQVWGIAFPYMKMTGMPGIFPSTTVKRNLISSR
jgi:alpha-mannosidase